MCRLASYLWASWYHKAGSLFMGVDQKCQSPPTDQSDDWFSHYSNRILTGTKGLHLQLSDKRVKRRIHFTICMSEVETCVPSGLKTRTGTDIYHADRWINWDYVFCYQQDSWQCRALHSVIAVQDNMKWLQSIKSFRLKKTITGNKHTNSHPLLEKNSTHS